MNHHKLVRDNIPEYIRTKGGTPLFHAAGEAEYWQKLKEKLREEVDEFNRDENQEEYADVLEALEAIRQYKGFDLDEIAKLKEVKAREKGRFEKRIILEEA
ncbi:MAG: nucleoside triphosphate pyrophosphohydrolase [bacterium]|nr:nucleoside triphosphate pyrophosphohydrolase [bacterium]MDZ4295812.1 nucleoside triphosphate pyrophosphohydrolase [Patescibacteria group bacterium]